MDSFVEDHLRIDGDDEVRIALWGWTEMGVKFMLLVGWKRVMQGCAGRNPEVVEVSGDGVGGTFAPDWSGRVQRRIEWGGGFGLFGLEVCQKLNVCIRWLDRADGGVRYWELASMC